MKMHKTRMTVRGWLAASAAATLLLALALWLGTVGSALAAPNTVTVVPSAATVAPGEQVTVQVVAEPPAGKKIGGWDLRLSFDANVLQPVDCGGQSNCNKDFAPGVVAFNGFSGAGLPGSQVLVTVTFKAIGASGTSSELTLAGDFNDEFADPTNPTMTGATISVQATPTPTEPPTATPAPTAAPTATPGALPPTGGAPSDGSGLSAWLLAIAGLAIVSGGAWVLATRMRRHI